MATIADRFGRHVLVGLGLLCERGGMDAGGRTRPEARFEDGAEQGERVGRIVDAEESLAGGGLVVMVAVAFTWTLRTWAERATGDDTVNAELYHRFIDPLRTPVVAIVCIGLVVGGVGSLAGFVVGGIFYVLVDNSAQALSMFAKNDLGLQFGPA